MPCRVPEATIVSPHPRPQVLRNLRKSEHSGRRGFPRGRPPSERAGSSDCQTTQIPTHRSGRPGSSQLRWPIGCAAWRVRVAHASWPRWHARTVNLHLGQRQPAQMLKLGDAPIDVGRPERCSWLAAPIALNPVRRLASDRARPSFEILESCGPYVGVTLQHLEIGQKMLATKA
jgi:hypothetical protein